VGNFALQQRPAQSDIGHKQRLRRIAFGVALIFSASP
jgi:hypothetical protein